MLDNMKKMKMKSLNMKIKIIIILHIQLLKADLLNVPEIKKLMMKILKKKKYDQKESSHNNKLQK